jgi:hypothetical protein
METITEDDVQLLRSAADDLDAIGIEAFGRVREYALSRADNLRELARRLEERLMRPWS